VSKPLTDALIDMRKAYPNRDISVLDMCSGGSGPNTLISTHVNKLMEERGSPNIQFYLTDLYPNLERWKQVCSTNPYLNYVETPVDITQPFTNLPKFDKIFQTFYCCFHHFDDIEIRKILKNSLNNSDGFA
jgi:hypothetical protein